MTSAASGQEPAAERGAARAVRLIFAYDASGVRVVRQYLREKLAPRGEDVRAEPRLHAIVLELLSATGVVLYRQTLVNPIPQTVEAIGPGGRLQRLPRARTKGAFSAVVPNLADATEAVLWAGPYVELRQPAFARQPGAAPGAPRARTRAVRKEITVGIADGNVTGVTKVLDQGADSSQWNLVVLGDGYTATEQSNFNTTVDNFIDILETVVPFSEAAWMRRLDAIYWRVGPVMARFVRPRRRLAHALRRCVLAPWARRLRRGTRSEGMV